MVLPDSALRTTWLSMRFWRAEWLPAIKAEFDRVCRASGWNPKVVNLDADTDMVDLCAYGDHDGGRMSPFPFQIEVTKIEDHPFLSDLPANAPRSVKQIYRSGFRLRQLRTTDALPIMAEIDRARDDWDSYKRNMKQNHRAGK